MEAMRKIVIGTSMVLALGLVAGCQKGPMQKAGARADGWLGQDPLIGKGPLEKAGKKADQAVDDVKR